MKKVALILFGIFLFLACPSLVFAGQININTATLSQLDELAGIGPKYAQAIIDSRPYSSLDDLLRVKGIGPTTLQKIKEQGFACVNCSTQTQNTTTQNSTQQTSTTSSLRGANEASNEAIPNTANSQNTAEIASSQAPRNDVSGIFINEIMPSPKGADETEEYIELYNSNNSDIDLSQWKLQDRAGTITTFTIPSITKILAHGFLVFKRTETKIMLNNDGDGLNLISPDGKTADSMGFVSAQTGQSYNKTLSDWAWSTTPTSGAVNIITAVQALPKPKKSDNNKVATAAVASASLPAVQTNKTSQSPSNNNPWTLFFTVLAATIILAAAVLFVKYKFLKDTNENVRT